MTVPLPFVASNLTDRRAGGGEGLEFYTGAPLKRALSCNIAKILPSPTKVIISRWSVLGNNQVSVKNISLHSLSFHGYMSIYTINSTVYIYLLSFSLTGHALSIYAEKLYIDSRMHDNVSASGKDGSGNKVKPKD